MRLTINLATRTYLNRSQINLTFAAVFILLLIFLVITIRTISTTIGESDRIHSELKAMEQKSGSKGRNVPEAEYQDLVKQIRFANAVINRKTYNWLGLLDKLESVVPDGVSFTAIDPGSKDKELKLSGTTLTFARLRQLLEHMEDSKLFTDIYLLSQSEARVGESQKGIVFNITCKVKL